MRARNIKPGLWKNEELAKCSLAARYMFPGLWCMADRKGLMLDRPLRIKAELYPYDDIDVDACLNELHNHGFIVRYSIGDMRYIKIVNFTSHQNPHHRETESQIPEPQSLSPGPDPAQARLLNRADSGFLIPDSLNLGRRRDELFDAIAEITHSDAKASASYIAKTAHALRRMEPPCTVAELRQLPAVLVKAFPILAGKPVTVGMIEKHIGLVRARPPDEDRMARYLQQSERAAAAEAERLKNQAARREANARANATEQPGSGESAPRGNVAV